MKNLVFFFLSLLLFSSCNKLPDLDLCPTNAGDVNCSVDGKTISNTCTTVYLTTQESPTYHQILSIIGLDVLRSLDGSAPDAVNVVVSISEEIKTGCYTIGSNGNVVYDGKELSNSIISLQLWKDHSTANSNGEYFTEEGDQMTICIDVIDAERVSGTFSGTVTNTAGEVKEIKNGAFDVEISL